MCQKNSGIFLRKFYVFLLLFFVLLPSANALNQEDIKNNLTLSLNQFQVLNNQINQLETDLNSKNLLLTNLENSNLELNNQLETLKIQFSNQMNISQNLSNLNKTLTDQLEQSDQHLIELNQSYQQLSTELSKRESNNIRNIFLSIIGGVIIGSLATWAFITFSK